MRRKRTRKMRRAESYAIIALLLWCLFLTYALITDRNERVGESMIILDEESIPLGTGEDGQPDDIPQEPERPTPTEKPREAERPTPTEKPREAERPTPTEKPVEPEQPTETEKPEEPKRPTPTEKSEEPERPTEAEKTKETEKPTQTEKPSEAEEPTTTERPRDTEETQTSPQQETEEPTETEQPGTSEKPAASDPPKPMPESPEDEDLAAAEPPPEITGEEPEDGDEGVTEQGSGSIQIGSREPASAAPGEMLTLAVPIRYLYGGRTYRSNAGANGGTRAYRAGHSAPDYDQSIADVLPWARVSIAEAQDRDFPLEPQTRSLQRTLIQGGANLGYAVFRGARVRDDAEPGVYPVRLIIDWTDDGGAQWQQALTLYVQVTAGDTGEADDEPEIIDEDDGQTEEDEEIIEPAQEDLPEEDEEEAIEDEITEGEPEGSCQLLTVPHRLDFEGVTLYGEPQMIGLTGAMTVEVLDTREVGGWTLKVMAEALTDGRNTLPGTLVFAHSDGRTETLQPGDSIVVAHKQEDAEPGVTRLTWPRGDGLHIRLEAHEAVPGARYTASVTWMLEVTNDTAESGNEAISRLPNDGIESEENPNV